MKLLSKVLIGGLMTGLLAAGPVLADGYPGAEEIDKIGTPESGPAEDPYGNTKANSGVFLGAGVSFGQARPTKDGSSPGVMYAGRFEPGYQIKTGSWNRLEVSGQFFTGSADMRFDEGKATFPLQLGMIAKFGYGYSVGSPMVMVLTGGAGPVLAGYEADVGGFNVESTETLTGLAGQIGGHLVMPATDSLDFVGGVELTHIEFDISDVEDDAGNKFPVDTIVAMNLIEARLEARLRF